MALIDVIMCGTAFDTGERSRYVTAMIVMYRSPTIFVCVFFVIVTGYVFL